MNERGHVINAALLAVGVGVVLEPTASTATLRSIAEVGVPLVLGALFPDVDTSFGTHRQTTHNLLTLGVVAAYPLVFGNLQWVWLGVVTHYALDVLGTTRGIALFWPVWTKEFGLPVGVTTDSRWTTPVTVVVTAFELAVIAGIVYLAPESISGVTGGLGL